MDKKIKVKQILTQKENDWCRFKCVDSDGYTFLAVGVIPNLITGAEMTLCGDFVNSQWGEQFKLTGVKNRSANKTLAAKAFMLRFCKGIGEKKADDIIAKFGNKTMNVIIDEPEKLLEVKGIKSKTYEKIHASIEENKHYLEIVTFTNGAITKSQADHIIETYSTPEEAIKKIKQNPYRLYQEVSGFGFKKADDIALASGLKLDSIERISAGITFTLENAANNGGHCYLPITEVAQQVPEVLFPIKDFSDISKKAVKNALEDWENKRELYIERYDLSSDTLESLDEINSSRKNVENYFTTALDKAIEEKNIINDDGCIYSYSLYKAETVAAEILSSMTKEHPVMYIELNKIAEQEKILEEKSGFSLTDEQKKAVRTGLMNRVSIITGGPGRGKTAITKVIAKSFQSSGGKILMLAPTGRAAQRITESTGYPAMTIHRALLQKKDMERVRYQKKLVVVDESSMIDIYLLTSLLKQFKDCNIIFVGDKDQIASVGPGSVLRDMINSGKIPCAFLKEGHRNMGSIAHNSELILEGRKINQYCYDEHFKYFPATKTTIREMMVKDFITQAEKYGIKNVMLCAAMKRGPLSVPDLNKDVQSFYHEKMVPSTWEKDKMMAKAIHPYLKLQDGSKYYVGDRVMQTKNCYTKELHIIKNGKQVTLPNGRPKCRMGIFNGDRGTVVSVDTEKKSITILFDDGGIGSFSQKDGELDRIVLAYATTVHKTQGSEAACVIMGYTYSDYLLLNRNLFYTAETRAKKEFRFYGEEKEVWGKRSSVFDYAVTQIGDLTRYTKLENRIS